MQSVIFSDKIRFALNTDGRIRVWRRRGERYKPQCTVLKTSFRFPVMFWGIIKPDGNFVLVKSPLPYKLKLIGTFLTKIWSRIMQLFVRIAEKTIAQFIEQKS